METDYSLLNEKAMEIYEMIYNVHEAMEGRYTITGYDLHMIHGMLCETQSKHCTCIEDQKHGETSVMCCNECGLPTDDFWNVNRCIHCGDQAVKGDDICEKCSVLRDV